MRIHRRVTALLAGTFLLLAATQVNAAGTGAEAAQQMQEGDAKRAAGDLKGALEHFKKADALVGVPTTGLEVGKVQMALGQLVEARDTFDRVSKLPALSNQPPVFATARVTAEQLRDELDAKIPQVQIVISNVDPTIAKQITVDSEEVPASALTAPRKINPGQHVIVVKVGQAEQKQDVEVIERDNKTLTFDFKDDAVVPSTSAKSKVLLYTGFGVGIVGIGVGAVTGLMSLSKKSDLEGYCPNQKCPPEHKNDLESTKTLGNISTVAFIVGGVGIATGIIGLVASSGSSKRESNAIAPKPRSTALFAPQQVQTVVGPSYFGLSGQF